MATEVPVDGEKPKQRVWRACVACRKKKIKCNGNEPCATCSVRQEECVYAETRDRAANSRQYVTQLENRLAQVEASLSRLADSGMPPPMSSSYPPQHQGFIPIPQPSSTSSFSQPMQLSGAESAQEDFSSSFRHAETSRQGVMLGTSHTSERAAGSPTALAWVTESDAYASPGANESVGNGAESDIDELTRDFSHIAVDKRGELRYIGGGTMGVLIESLGSIKPKQGQQPIELPFLGSATSASSGGRTEAAWLPRMTDFGFPPRDVLLRLVDTYFRRIHPLFPILNRSIFRKRLDSNHMQTDTAFAALVFAVAAAASMLVPGYGTSASTAVGNEWLERASILHYRCSRVTSLTHVQCLGIMGSYLAAINDLPAAWLVTGQAMRTAQDLGLHRSTARLSLRPCEMQERRRVFWCIYGQDRGISCALGRSMGIDDGDVDVELPFDMSDEDLVRCSTLADVRPTGKSNLMSGFIALTQVHIIARKSKKNHRILDRIPDTSDPSCNDTLRRLCQPIETALDRWAKNLPACIRDATEEDEDPTYWMQSVLCFIQHLTTSMNSFRPTISGARSTRCFSSDDTSGSAFSTYFAKVRKDAMRAAGLGTVIRRAIAPSHELGFAVEQTLLAGVILVRCVPLCRDTSEAAETAMAAKTCVASLAALEAWPGAARCREILDELVTQVVAADQVARTASLSPTGKRKLPGEMDGSSRPSKMPAPLALWEDVREKEQAKRRPSIPVAPSTNQPFFSNDLSSLTSAPAMPRFEEQDLFGNSTLAPFSFDFLSTPSELPSAFIQGAAASSAPDSTAAVPSLDLSDLPFPGLSFLSDYASGDGAMNWDASNWMN